jgi:hypothetical protein
VSVPTVSISAPPENKVVQRVSLIVRNRFCTAPNTFGLWKEYLYRPSYDPDAFISPDDLYHPHASVINHIPNDNDKQEGCSGYTNKSVELLMDWQNTGSSTKSNGELTRLVHDVLLHPEFQLSSLANFNAAHENQKADSHDKQTGCHRLLGRLARTPWTGVSSRTGVMILPLIRTFLIWPSVLM